VRKLLAENENPAIASRIDPDIKALEERMAEKLGAKVLVQANAKGKGKLTIHYNNLDELDGILAHIH